MLKKVGMSWALLGCCFLLTGCPNPPTKPATTPITQLPSRPVPSADAPQFGYNNPYNNSGQQYSNPQFNVQQTGTYQQIPPPPPDYLRASQLNNPQTNNLQTGNNLSPNGFGNQQFGTSGQQFGTGGSGLGGANPSGGGSYTLNPNYGGNSMSQPLEGPPGIPVPRGQ